MTGDPNLYELILHSADASQQPHIIKVEGTSPLELIDAARDMSEVKPGGVNPPPREVLAVVNGLPIARFLGRWMWDNHNPDYAPEPSRWSD